MRKYFVVCFELGYDVEAMTELYNSLAGRFGYGGSTERTEDGKVTDFKVSTVYGVLELDYSKKVLHLRTPKPGGLSSKEIGVLFETLKKISVIKSDKMWYIEAKYMLEVV